MAASLGKKKIALIAVDLGVAFDAQGFHSSPSYVPATDRDALKWVRFSSQTPPIKKTHRRRFYFVFSFSRFKHCLVGIQNRALSHTFIFTRIYIDLNRSRDRLWGRGLSFPPPAIPGQPDRCVFIPWSPLLGLPGSLARGFACAGSGVFPQRPGSGGGAVTVTPSDIMSAAARQTCPSPLPLQPYGAVNSRAGTGFCCCCCVRVPRPFSPRVSPGCGRGSPAPLLGLTSPGTGRGTGAAAEGEHLPGPPLGEPRPGVRPGETARPRRQLGAGAAPRGAQPSPLSQPGAGSIN